MNCLLSSCLLSVTTAAAGANPISLFGLRPEFILFGLTLLGVAIFHHHTLKVAATGLVLVAAFKAGFTGFDFIAYLSHEWQITLNLFGLLLGFTILALHFEESGIPAILPKYLPDSWWGGVVLLVLVFFISAFLDNIAAAMIGGTIALSVYRHKVHLSFVVAIVAASNAGGSGSVVGDTTTTMMWIDGIPALELLPAYFAAFPALFVVALPAAYIQQKHQPILADPAGPVKIDGGRVLIVCLILLLTLATNIWLDFPALGVWTAIILGSFFRKTDWRQASHAIKGALFLICLVLTASMMPVEELPPASWQSALTLGFVSAVFDNIPLTKLALAQGGYDWGVLAFAVGFGGSMLWFGSSAGVALSTIFKEARSVISWVKHGWFVIFAYLAGFLTILLTHGWKN